MCVKLAEDITVNILMLFTIIWTEVGENKIIIVESIFVKRERERKTERKKGRGREKIGVRD